METLRQIVYLLTAKASLFAQAEKKPINSLHMLYAYLEAAEYSFPQLDAVNQGKIASRIAGLHSAGFIFPDTPSIGGIQPLADDKLVFDQDGNAALEEIIDTCFEYRLPSEITMPLFALLRVARLKSGKAVREKSTKLKDNFDQELFMGQECRQIPLDERLPRGKFIFRDVADLTAQLRKVADLDKTLNEDEEEEEGESDEDGLGTIKGATKMSKDHWDIIADDLKLLEKRFGNDSPRHDTFDGHDSKNDPPLHFISDMNIEMRGQERSYFHDSKMILNAEIALEAKDSLLIQGKPGVGKSQLVKELVARMNSNQIQGKLLKKSHIYKIDANALIANCSWEGQFEGRVNALLAFVKKPTHQGMILYFDELSLVMGLGSDVGHTHTGINDYFKEPMSEGKIMLIGCCTLSESLEIQRIDPAFYRRFDTIAIQEISTEELRPLLAKEIDEKAQESGMSVSPNFVESVILMGNLLENGEANPAKDLKLIDRAFNYALLTDKKRGVDSEVLSNAIMSKYNLKIQEDAALKTKKALLERIQGQKRAIEEVYAALLGIEQKLPKENRPSATLAFFGPSGVGKTETARIIAEEFCGSANALVKIDCGGFSSPEDVDYLFGGPQGGVLTQALSLNPRCCVLFDEIEKAPSRLMMSIMAMMDDGIVKDLSGLPHSARGAIIIFTSNVGGELHLGEEERNGFLQQETTEKDFLSIYKKYFRMEFLSRIDQKIVFDHLSDAVLTSLILQDVKQARARASQAILPLDWSEEDTRWVKEDADVESQGARAIESSVEKRLLSLYRKKYEL